MIRSEKTKVKCENNHGQLGVQSCGGYNGSATTVLTVIYSKNPFNKTGNCQDTLFLCSECAKRVKADAEGHGYEVKTEKL